MQATTLKSTVVPFAPQVIRRQGLLPHRFSPADSFIPLCDLFDKFIVKLKTDRRGNTHISYRRHFDSFLKVEDTFTEDSVRRFIVSEQEKGNSNNSIVTKLSALRSFSRWAFTEGYITKHFMLNVSVPKDKKVKESITLNADNVFKHIESRCREEWTVARNKALFTMFLATGCRVSELTHIRIEDLRLEELKTKISSIGAKGGKERWVYFNEECVPFFENYIALRNTLPQSDCPYLFVSHAPNKTDGSYQLTRQGVHYIVGKHTKTTGQKLSSHKLRHWCATFLLNSGVDIYTVQMILGHEDISTTEIYLHADEKRKQAATVTQAGMFKRLNSKGKDVIL